MRRKRSNGKSDNRTKQRIREMKCSKMEGNRAGKTKKERKCKYLKRKEKKKKTRDKENKQNKKEKYGREMKDTNIEDAGKGNQNKPKAIPNTMKGEKDMTRKITEKKTA